MTYIAVKRIKGRKYYYVVESAKNKQGQSRHKIIAYLGSEAKLLETLKRINYGLK